MSTRSVATLSHYEINVSLDMKNEIISNNETNKKEDSMKTALERQTNLSLILIFARFWV